MKRFFIAIAMILTLLGCSNSNNGKEPTLQGMLSEVERNNISRAIYFNKIFNEDVLVHDTVGNKINLRKIEISKDSVMFIFWSKTCPPCIKKLDLLKAQNRQETIQIIGISHGGKSNVGKIKKIIAEHSWPFDFYFDTTEDFIKYMIQNKYLVDSRYYRFVNGHYNLLVPQTYLFVNNKFHCFGCGEIINN